MPRLAILLMLVVGACAQLSPQREALVGCTAYVSALESLTVRKRAGLLSERVIFQVDNLRSVATPLCTAAEIPPADGQVLLDDVLLQLEAILAAEAAKEAN